MGPSRFPTRTMVALKSLAVASAIMIIPGLAQAQSQQVLVNGGFEAYAAPNMGNNTNSPNIAPWVIGGGAPRNVVRVNGGVYPTGPNVDASGMSGIRQYLDVVGGANTVTQTFTPLCGGTVTFSGYFSSRISNSNGNPLPGTGSIQIRQGNAGNALLAQTPVASLTTAVWQQVSATVSVNANIPYNFVVNMDENLNFDEGSVVYNQTCNAGGGGNVNTDVIYGEGGLNPNLVYNVLPTLDPCCPPWNEQMLSAALRYSSTGAINSPYTLQWQMPAGLNAQMQAYINYLNALDPSMTTISVAFGIFQAGNGAAPGPAGPQVGGTGGTRIVTWTSGGSAPSFSGGTFFPANFLQPNQWYTVGTTTFLNDGIAFFGENCINKSISVRWQVAPGIGAGPTGAGAGRGPAVRSMEVRPAPRAIGPMGPARRALPQRR